MAKHYYAASYYYGRGVIDSASGKEIRALQCWTNQAERDAWVAADPGRDAVPADDPEVRAMVAAMQRFDAGARDPETCKLAESGWNMYQH